MIMIHRLLCKFIYVAVLVAFALPLSAQQHRERWKFDDYFPKNYFFDDKEDGDKNDAVGEVVFYMRLAGVAPLRDIPLGKDECVLRLNYIPKFAHPLFVQVRQKDNRILLTWQKGNALRGHVEHTERMLVTDTGLVDVTENDYYGNEWEKGIVDSGSRELFPFEWQQIQQILKDIDFIHYPSCSGCSGFRTPYILEFKDNKNSISYYTECPNSKKENRVTELLVALVDTDYVDMVINRTGGAKSTIPPAFPGGEEACAAFIQKAIHYPPEALRDLEEYRARVEFVVEKDGSIGLVKDGSWPPSDYGFADELIRVVKTMPKWVPGTEKGKTVRCYAYVYYQFVLPTDIRPQYGKPILETNRDKRSWEKIEACHRKLLQNPLDENNILLMGKYYYREYLLANEPLDTPTYFDSIHYKDDWASYYDSTPVVAQPGDSALKYFYQALQWNPDTKTLINLYLPILQLEYNLKKTHNPLAELPYDTVEGVHFPYSYFVNRPENDTFDNSTDYLGETSSSFFWVDAFSKDLTKMQEPVLYNNQLQEDETIFRFSFFPSFHPPVSFRVVKNKGEVTLYWKILLTKYDPNTWKEISTTVNTGHRKMTAAQYEKLLQYMEAVRLDELPRSKYVMMLDGAQWVMERMTDQGFKAHFTNVAGNDIQQVYSFLAKLSGEKLKYIEEYY